MSGAVLAALFCAAATPARGLKVVGEASGRYDRFGDHFAYDLYDFSGVGWQTAIISKGFTMITPRHFVAAKHYKFPVGTNMTLRSRSGVDHELWIDSRRDIEKAGATTDTTLYTSRDPVPAEAGIAAYRILVPADPTLLVGRRFLIYGWIHKVGHAVISSSSALSPTFWWPSSTNEGWAMTESGDSGSPSFHTISNRLFLAGTHWYVGGDMRLGDVFEELRAAVLEDGYLLLPQTSLDVLDPPLTLVVSNAHGPARPAAGTHVYDYGPTLSGSVEASPVETGYTQYVCVGWTGSGSVAPSGTATGTPPFLLAEDSVLSWLWETNYWLAMDTQGEGEVDAGAGWYAAQTGLTVTATASNWHFFAGWSGAGVPAGAETNNPLILPMTRARTIKALFEPYLAARDVPVWWLMHHGLGTNESDVVEDSDADGLANWQEYVAGTDPTNPASVLAASGVLDVFAPYALVPLEQDFDDWPDAPMTVLGTYSNGAWIVHRGLIRAGSASWPYAASDPYAAWLDALNASADPWIRTPRAANGVGTVSFAHRPRIADGETLEILVELSEDGLDPWMPAGAVTNDGSSGHWTIGSVDCRHSAPAYVRLRRGPHTVSTGQLLGLDDIRIEAAEFRQPFDDWPGAPMSVLGTYTNGAWIVNRGLIRAGSASWPYPASDPYAAWLDAFDPSADAWLRSPQLPGGIRNVRFAHRLRLLDGIPCEIRVETLPDGEDEWVLERVFTNRADSGDWQTEVCVVRVPAAVGLRVRRAPGSAAAGQFLGIDDVHVNFAEGYRRTFAVRWHGVEGRRYTLQEALDAAGPWTAVPAYSPVWGAGAPIEYLDAEPAFDRRFFRIVVEH